MNINASNSPHLEVGVDYSMFTHKNVVLLIITPLKLKLVDLQG